MSPTTSADPRRHGRSLTTIETSVIRPVISYSGPGCSCGTPFRFIGTNAPPSPPARQPTDRQTDRCRGRRKRKRRNHDSGFSFSLSLFLSFSADNRTYLQIPCSHERVFVFFAVRGKEDEVIRVEAKGNHYIIRTINEARIRAGRS